MTQEKSQQYRQEMQYADPPPYPSGIPAPLAPMDAKVPSFGIITEAHPLYTLLAHPILVLEKQIQIGNLAIGLEEVNKYSIRDANGIQVGWAIEQGEGLSAALKRQTYKNHRPFVFDVIDMQNRLLMRIKRPFRVVNSHDTVTLPDGQVIGETIHKWHPIKRKYDLFVNQRDKAGLNQFGKIGGRTLSWEFLVYDNNDKVIGSVNKDFTGIIRELYTDTGVYILRMDPQILLSSVHAKKDVADRVMTLEERAVLLASAISVDFDYFSTASSDRRR